MMITIKNVITARDVAGSLSMFFLFLHFDVPDKIGRMKLGISGLDWDPAPAPELLLCSA